MTPSTDAPAIYRRELAVAIEAAGVGGFGGR
jgi:hypothetical protein